MGPGKNTYLAVFYYICFVSMKKAFWYRSGKVKKPDIERVW
jgi:hypothetical protein